MVGIFPVAEQKMNRAILPQVLPALACVLLLLAAVLGRWPYSFYVLLRIITCVVCVYLCSRAIADKRAAI